MSIQFPSSQPPRIGSDVKDLAVLKPSMKSISINANIKNYERLAELRAITSIAYAGTLLPTPIAKALSSAPNLNYLWLGGLREFTHKLTSPTLKIVHLRQCAGLEDFSFLRPCRNIETVWTLHCKNLKSFRGLESHSKLRILEIQGSLATLSDLRPLQKLQQLVMLAIHARITDKSLAGIASPHLERLRLNNFFSESEYQGVLARCPKLKRIDLHNGTFTRQRGFKEDKV